jgi:hypothetical protein
MKLKPHPSFTELLLKNPVFLRQYVDLQLTLVHPCSNGSQHEPERVHNSWHLVSSLSRPFQGSSQDQIQFSDHGKNHRGKGRKLKTIRSIEMEATRMAEKDVLRIFELLQEKAAREKDLWARSGEQVSWGRKWAIAFFNTFVQKPVQNRWRTIRVRGCFEGDPTTCTEGQHQAKSFIRRRRCGGNSPVSMAGAILVKDAASVVVSHASQTDATHQR